MVTNNNIEEKISTLDTSLYFHIKAQLTEEDRRSLLAIQKFVRKRKAKFCYLEIGSYLGGSIQPYLRDPNCYWIYSIDKRSLYHPDERGTIEYENNSEETMLGLLKQISEKDVSKISCFNCDSKKIQTERISKKPDICFIDGQHTNDVVISDFDFCLSVINPDGVICFHDAEIVNEGLLKILRQLREKKIKFNAVKLLGSVFLILLGDSFLDVKQQLDCVIASSEKDFFKGVKLHNLYKQYSSHLIVRSMKPFFKFCLKSFTKLKRNIFLIKKHV